MTFIMTINNTNLSPETNVIMDLFMNSKDLFVNPIVERADIKLATTNRSGVYLWYSKLSGKYYVGSSVDLYKRLSRYYQPGYLAYPNHADLPIVRAEGGRRPPGARGALRAPLAITKYGLENFILVILDYTKKSNIHISEQYYIDTLYPIYNIRQVAGFRSGKLIKKNSLTEELRGPPQRPPE